MAELSVKAAYADGNLTVTVDGLTGIGEIYVNNSGSPLTFVQAPKGEVTSAVALDGEGTVTVFDTITTKKVTCKIGDAQPENNPLMDFADAIRAVKAGKRISRTGWNGKNQFIELASCLSYKNAAGEIINAEHDAIGSQALAFVGTSGIQIGWLASQADMLANDWQIAS